MEGCKPAGDTTLPESLYGQQRGKTKSQSGLFEYGQKRVRHWDEQIIRAGQESVKRKQSNDHTQNPNKTKGLGENRKLNAKTVIHESTTQLLNKPPVTHQGSQS